MSALQLPKNLKRKAISPQPRQYSPLAFDKRIPIPTLIHNNSRNHFAQTPIPSITKTGGNLIWGSRRSIPNNEIKEKKPEIGIYAKKRISLPKAFIDMKKVLAHQENDFEINDDDEGVLVNQVRTSITASSNPNRKQNEHSSRKISVFNSDTSPLSARLVFPQKMRRKQNFEVSPFGPSKICEEIENPFERNSENYEESKEKSEKNNEIHDLKKYEGSKTPIRSAREICVKSPKYIEIKKNSCIFIIFIKI